jgi:CheY-like chemotaxis protein
MQKGEERWKKILDQQRREHHTAREAIEAELKTLKTSERPLTTEEIAAIRNESFGGDEPFGTIEPINPTEPIPAFVEEPAAPVEDRKPLILIVHHNPALRAMTRDALSGMDYNVLTAADGAEGLKMARNLRPDIVIADAAMPKMDGRELCQALKRDEATAATKVVLMSAMYTNEMSMAALETDVPPDGILQKPVKPEALKASVSGLLAVHS